MISSVKIVHNKKLKKIRIDKMTYSLYYNGVIMYDDIPSKEQAYRMANSYRSFVKCYQLDVKVSVRKNK